jgi:O-antigen/teichoic acid export membrane protein
MSRLKRNTVWYGAVTVLGLGSGLLMSIVLARGLGPGLMGDFSYIIAAQRLAYIAATLGFGVGTVRYAADALGRGQPAHAAGVVAMFLRWQAVSTTIVVLAVTSLVLALAPDTMRWPLVVAIATLVPLTLETIYMRATYGAQRYDITALVSTAKMTLLLVASIVALLLGTGLAGVLVAQGLMALVSCLLQRSQARSLYPMSPAPVEPATVREIRSFVIPISVVTFLEILIWDRTEVFVLRLWVPAEQIAFYGLGYGLAARLMVLPSIVVGPLLPALAALHGRSEHREFNRVYQTAVRWASLAGAPLTAVAATVAPTLIVLLYGEAYQPVVWLFRVFVVVAVLGAVCGVAATALTAAGARRALLHAAIWSVILDLVLTVALVPVYRTGGAVVAGAATQVLYAVWLFVAIYRVKGAALPVFDIAGIVAGAGLTFIVTGAIAGDSVSVVLSALASIVGIGVFIATCTVLGIIRPDEWRQILAWPRRLLPTRFRAEHVRPEGAEP